MPLSILDQWEAGIQVTWSLSTNQREADASTHAHSTQGIGDGAESIWQDIKTYNRIQSLRYLHHFTRNFEIVLIIY